MTPSIALLLVIIGLALLLFSVEWLAVDVVGLGILLTLILAGLLTPEQAFAGFGSDTVLTILALFILTAALLRTGVVGIVERILLRYAGDHPIRLLLVVMGTARRPRRIYQQYRHDRVFCAYCPRLSRADAYQRFQTPHAPGICLYSDQFSYAGGHVHQHRHQRAPYGAQPPAYRNVRADARRHSCAVGGLIYMLVIGRKLVPDRSQPDDLIADFGSRLYFTEIRIRPDSKLIGKTLAESGVARKLDLNILRLVSAEGRYLMARPSRRLQAGDRLLVEGPREELVKVQEEAAIDIEGDLQLSDPQLKTEDMLLVEAIILPRSRLIGLTPGSIWFRQRYGLQVLAIYRRGETLRQKLSQIRLRVGDVLLIQSQRANVQTLRALEEDNLFHVLGAVNEERPKLQRAPLAVAIFAVALAVGALDLVSVPVALLLGVLFAFLTGCVSPEQAYREVEWRALILIGSFLAIGRAMQETGAASFLAAQIVDLVGASNPLWLLTAFFFLAVLLTQPMSNQAAAAVVVPVAVQVALQLDLDPRPIAMMIAVAASTSYLTLLEPSCLMVYGPGGYRFLDFLKVGSFLTVLIYIIAILLGPRVWPLS